jgi:gas vesicle protein
MGETVDALGYKADVKGRAKDKVSETRDKITGTLSDAKDRVVGGASDTTSRVSDATPSAAEVKGQAKRAASVAQENPLGLAIGSIAVGFVAGLLVPATRFEDEKLGEASDQVIEKAKQTGQEALEHGKQVAQETAQTASDSIKQAAGQVKETAQQTAQAHAEELKASAQDSAQEVARQAPTP